MYAVRLCDGGDCISDSTVECDDGNDCTTDLVMPVQALVECPLRPIATMAMSVQKEICDGVTRTGGPVNACDDGDVCTIDSCDPIDGCTNVVDPTCGGNPGPPNGAICMLTSPGVQDVRFGWAEPSGDSLCRTSVQPEYDTAQLTFDNFYDDICFAPL